MQFCFFDYVSFQRKSRKRILQKRHSFNPLRESLSFSVRVVDSEPSTVVESRGGLTNNRTIRMKAVSISNLRNSG